MTTNAVQHPETGDLRLSSISISVITIPGQRRNSTFTIRLLQLSWSHTQNPYLHKKFNVRLFTVCGHVVDSPLRCFHPESLHPPQESSDLFILIHEPWRSILPSINSSRWDSEFFFFFLWALIWTQMQSRSVWPSSGEQVSGYTGGWSPASAPFSPLQPNTHK